MTAPRPTQPGTTNRGPVYTQANVLSVDGNIAVVRDGTGRTLQIDRSMMRAKGNPPMPGEVWMIDRAINNQWTFAMIMGASTDGVIIPEANVVGLTDDLAGLTARLDALDAMKQMRCRVALTADITNFTAQQNIFAQGGWAAQEDPLGMFSRPGTNAQITIPAGGSGDYEINYITRFSGTSSTVPSTNVCFVTKNSATSMASVARDDRLIVSNLPGDKTAVQAIRIVPLVEGDILYWGYWVEATQSLYASNLNIPTEIYIRRVR